MESDDTPVTDPDLSHAPIKMVSVPCASPPQCVMCIFGGQVTAPGTVGTYVVLRPVSLSRWLHRGGRGGLLLQAQDGVGTSVQQPAEL